MITEKKNVALCGSVDEQTEDIKVQAQELNIQQKSIQISLSI